jgi:hypothetical protein
VSRTVKSNLSKIPVIRAASLVRHASVQITVNDCVLAHLPAVGQAGAWRL